MMKKILVAMILAAGLTMHAQVQIAANSGGSVVINGGSGGGGSMTWPSVAGITYWTSGTAWGGAYNSSTPIPANYLPSALSSSTSVNGTSIPASATLFTTSSTYGGTLTSGQVTAALTFTPVAPTVTALSSLTTAAGGAFGSGAYAAVYSLPTATSSILGGVKPDGVTISNSSGVINVANPVLHGTLTVTSGTAFTALQKLGPFTVSISGLTTSMACSVEATSDTHSIAGWGAASSDLLVITDWNTSGTFNYYLNDYGAGVTTGASVTFNISCS